MNTNIKRHMERFPYMLQQKIEKFFQSIFLKIKETITISLSNENIVINNVPRGIIVTSVEPNEELYFSKEATLKRGPFKMEINSEHRGGEMYKNFVTVYFCGMKVFETFWRTEKGNDYGFHTTGFEKD